MSKLLEILSSKYVVLMAFILTLIFIAGIFPHYHQFIKAPDGALVKTLDTRFSYSPEEIQKDFSLIEEIGRDTHRFLSAKIDMIFPIIYGSFVISIFLFLLKKLDLWKFNWICIVPVAIIFLDTYENFNTIAIIDNFPQIDSNFILKASKVTSFKHILSLTSMGMIVLLLCGLVFNFVINTLATRNKER